MVVHKTPSPQANQSVDRVNTSSVQALGQKTLLFHYVRTEANHHDDRPPTRDGVQNQLSEDACQGLVVDVFCEPTMVNSPFILVNLITRYFCIWDCHSLLVHIIGSV